MIKYREGYKYQLHEPVQEKTLIIPHKYVETPFCSMDREGNLYIRAGYAWDGGSAVAIDDSVMIYASLFHDAIYQLIREAGLSSTWRLEADNILRQKLLDGYKEKHGLQLFAEARAWWVYKAVRNFGDCYASDEVPVEILTAP